MAVGNEAKEQLINKIIDALGDSYLGCYDKKYYFMSKEDGQPKQVAITLTCPKTLVGVNASVPTSAFSGGLDFENMGTATAAPEPFKPAEITEDERETVKELMARLGL